MAPVADNAISERWPSTDRARARVTRGTFILHLRPIRLSRRAVRWTHTFGLGGSALVLWAALAASGVLMLLVYQPTPGGAYGSVRTLTHSVPFGPLVRGVHFWSANLLIAAVLLHTARVVLTGGFHRPRRLNWVIGAALLLLVLASAFTGYLLPWDQRAYWAVTISTGMLAYVPWIGTTLQDAVRGGSEIGAGTLLTFHTFHTTVLPGLAIGFLAFHFWRVRKAGGVIESPAPSPGDGTPEARGTSSTGSDNVPAGAGPEWAGPAPGQIGAMPLPDGQSGAMPYQGGQGGAMPLRRDTVMFFPDLLVREIAQAFVILAIVIVLGVLAGAPIGERANPGMSPNPAKAPWYFMGFQELLIHLHPIFAVVVFPLAAVVGLLALPWLGDDPGPAGPWFLSRRARRAAAIAAGAAAVLCSAGVMLDEHFGAATPGAAWFLRGVAPAAMYAGLAAAVVAGTRRAFGLGRNESVQTLVVFLAVSFVVLTMIGVFFRGPGMALTLPWGG